MNYSNHCDETLDKITNDISELWAKLRKSFYNDDVKLSVCDLFKPIEDAYTDYILDMLWDKECFDTFKAYPNPTEVINVTLGIGEFISGHGIIPLLHVSICDKSTYNKMMLEVSPDIRGNMDKCTYDEYYMLEGDTFTSLESAAEEFLDTIFIPHHRNEIDAIMTVDDDEDEDE